MDRELYYDNAATSPLDPRVLDEMRPWLERWHGNAHSIHTSGRRAMAAVDLARTRLASLIEAEDPSQIIFTSGATEANNWVLSNFTKIAISPFEHSSIREPALLKNAEIVRNEAWQLSSPITTTEPDSLLSVMLVNNETGALLEMPTFDGRTHCDITQAVGKIPVNAADYDFASLSAHKFYGPMGVGALYVKEPTSIKALLAGGGQENGLRSGTLNVPGIVGLGAAAAIADEERERDFMRASECLIAVEEAIAAIPDVCHNSPNRELFPHIFSVSFLGLQGETLLLELDRQGYSVSSGAACSSTDAKQSTVLKALAVSDEWARGTIRISFGRFNTPENAAKLGKSLAGTVNSLRMAKKSLF